MLKVSAMRKEIQNVFDESLVVSQSSGVFTIDFRGRAFEVGQGTGLVISLVPMSKIMVS